MGIHVVIYLPDRFRQIQLVGAQICAPTNDANGNSAVYWLRDRKRSVASDRSLRRTRWNYVLTSMHYCYATLGIWLPISYAPLRYTKYYVEFCYVISITWVLYVDLN